MSKEGGSIDNFDAKLAVKKNAENAHDWEFSDEAKYLYGMAEAFRDRFFLTMLPTDQGNLPDPVISFDDLRNKKTLAAYTLHRNPQGLLDEITFNKVHYEDQNGQQVWKFGRWAQLETLLHEQVHLWQQNFGKRSGNPERVTHNKEFVDLCERLGLHPLPVVGAHYAVADGPFAQFMGELGIPRPEEVPRIEGKPSKRDWFRQAPEKGKTTLHKWVCPDCGLNVRIGIGSDPHLVHDVCSEIRGEKVFLVRHDGLEHTIYENKDDKKLEEAKRPSSPINTLLEDAEPEKSKKEKRAVPPFVNEINEHLQKAAKKGFTLQGIAKKAGISKSRLYDWLENDPEFTTALEGLVDAQENDPYKTNTEEDAYVNSLMLTLLLLETRDRHFKAKNN